MISVVRTQQIILVNCSLNEVITVDKIKSIVKTIKRIDKNIDSPCKISVNSIHKLNFTLHGELFFKKILTTSIIRNPRMRIKFEK